MRPQDDDMGTVFLPAFAFECLHRCVSGLAQEQICPCHSEPSPSQAKFPRLIVLQPVWVEDLGKRIQVGA